MSFMQLYTDGPIDWIEFENCFGESTLCPAVDFEWRGVEHEIENAADGRSITIRIHRNKYGARYSAPGYLDCTDWCIADTEEEAVKDCKELYGDDEEDQDTDSGNESNE